MKTVILGASDKPERASYQCAALLTSKGLEFEPVGIKNNQIFGRQILQITEKPAIKDVHTVTMYMGKKNQLDWYDYILKLNPSRIIFNPGAENDELHTIATENGIHCENACSLVLLTTDQYLV